MEEYINALIDYALSRGLIECDDRIFAFNRILEIMRLDAPTGSGAAPAAQSLPEILNALTDDAVRRGIADDNIASRDLFDTGLMGALTPAPHEVRKKFYELYSHSPKAATDWFYKFSADTDYIRMDRAEKDLKWKFGCEYGDLDITINLSKPEKDPRAIAAAKLAPQNDYPRCMLCAENEGYAGRPDHPARQNHRLIPVDLGGESWYFQYSPYVYYNEHCIAPNSRHVPMKIDRSCFEKLFDFVSLFPHYFIGSNADLPIVGGSILSHDHFQGGRFEFAMAKAEHETEVSFNGFGDVKCWILKWPMSVIRLTSPDRTRIALLAEKILNAWRAYSDVSSFIFGETEDGVHNTITPVARRRGDDYELDLVLRNNLTTAEHPLGVFHPHEKYHHIKKENIGLIEVMGCAILPPRLIYEMRELKQALLSGKNISAIESISKHAAWAEDILSRRTFDIENADTVLKDEIGRVFEHVLEDAGVFKRTPEGKRAFIRFIESID